VAGLQRTVPGPVLRLPQGEPFEPWVETAVEPTSEHWHAALRLRNAMEGVPDLTQAAIPPGASFTYDLYARMRSIYWYHRNADSMQQLGVAWRCANHRGSRTLQSIGEPRAHPNSTLRPMPKHWQGFAILDD